VSLIVLLISRPIVVIVCIVRLPQNHRLGPNCTFLDGILIASRTNRLQYQLRTLAVRGDTCNVPWQKNAEADVSLHRMET
jgi:hypothetical protein